MPVNDLETLLRRSASWPEEDAEMVNLKSLLKAASCHDYVFYTRPNVSARFAVLHSEFEFTHQPDLYRCDVCKEWVLGDHHEPDPDGDDGEGDAENDAEGNDGDADADPGEGDAGMGAREDDDVVPVEVLLDGDEGPRPAGYNRFGLSGL